MFMLILCGCWCCVDVDVNVDVDVDVNVGVDVDVGVGVDNILTGKCWWLMCHPLKGPTSDSGEMLLALNM